MFYGEYLNGQDGGFGVDDLGDAVAGNDVVVQATGSELEVWGVGIVQEVDAAAMSVWVKYRHLEVDGLVDSTGAAVGGDDFDYVGVGGLINF